MFPTCAQRLSTSQIHSHSFSCFVTSGSLCSTPFDISDPFTVGQFAVFNQWIRVLNAFRHLRSIHSLQTVRSVAGYSAQRLSTSQIHSHLGEDKSLAAEHCVLNAFRHLRSIHARQREACLFRDGAQRLPTSQIHSPGRVEAETHPDLCAQRLSTSQIHSPGDAYLLELGDF